MTNTPKFEKQAQLVAQSFGLALGSFVGSGAFKETFQASTPQGCHVALKIINRSKINLARTKREIEALQRCDSPHIAKIQHWQSFDEPGLTGIDVVVEEFLDGGTLEDRGAAQRLSPAGIAILGSGLSAAVIELHQHDLVHRDIKPANIMFRAGSPEPVLVDFGLVRDLRKESLTQSWMPNGPCTPFYAPAEQLNNEKHMIDWRADQFAIGVVLIEALLGRHPYATSDADSDDTLSAVASRSPVPDNLSIDLKKLGVEFLTRLVQPWPVQRVAKPAELLKLFTDLTI